MTKEEIVLALRVCGNEESCCPRCPYFNIAAWKFRCNEKDTEAADLIEAQAAEIEKLKAQVPGWIPVTERLPEVHQNTRKSDAMLVYTRRKLFMVAVWNGIDWLVPKDFGNAWGDEIVYWMPLPEVEV
nr:MAG TPA: Protein of unknown function (DUF551) [Caudoviricetes sp.]